MSEKEIIVNEKSLGTNYQASLSKEARLLAKFLHIAQAGPSEAKDVIETLPKKLAFEDPYNREKVTEVRKLLLSENINSTALLQTAFASTVAAGAEPLKCMRQAIPVVTNFKGMTFRWPYGSTGTYANQVSEGGEIPLELQDYGNRDFTIYKYGTRPVITGELIDDGLYDIISMEVQKGGARIENALNQASMSVILENSGAAQDCGGSGATPLAFLAKAVANVNANGFNADTLIMHPIFYGALLATFTGVSNNLGAVYTTSGSIGTLIGCKVFQTGVTDTSATYNWNFASDNDIGCMAIDSTVAGGIAMRRDITVEKFRDPIRDLMNCVITARFGVNYLQANGAVRVQY